MKHVICTALLAGGVLSTSSAALAADFVDFPSVPEVVRFEETFRDVGFYAGARGGVAFADDTDFDLTPATRIDNDYDMGLTGSLVFGFDIPDLYLGAGLRLEGEIGYSQFDIDTHTVGGTLVAAGDSFGSTDALLGMANVYIDYGFGAFRPFIGAGIGVARVDFDDHGVNFATNVMDDADNGWAWQAMGGLAYDVNTSITVEAMVRYQSIMDVDLMAATGQASSTDLSNTQVLIGARFHF